MVGNKRTGTLIYFRKFCRRYAIVKKVNITSFGKSMSFLGPNQHIFAVKASNQAKKSQLLIKLSSKMKNSVTRYAYYRRYVYYQL